MTIDYSRIKAYPTIYGGVRFRSRLEATWAAFFDQIEWQWQYEPFDLGKWSPDFLISGAGRDLLVEVKPTGSPDIDVVEKITSAGGIGYVLLYCGVAPRWKYVGKRLADACMSSSCCGDQRIGCWTDRPFYKIHGKYDIVVGHGDFHPGVTTGVNADISADLEYYVGDEIMALWNKAKNSLQWRAPR